jgi:hypothetical protein
MNSTPIRSNEEILKEARKKARDNGAPSLPLFYVPYILAAMSESNKQAVRVALEEASKHARMKNGDIDGIFLASNDGGIYTVDEDSILSLETEILKKLK